VLDDTIKAVQADSNTSLDWENRGDQTLPRAFLRGASELLFQPRIFFKKMATSGGLQEPLMFFWIIATVIILMAFPVAFARFEMTAPDPAKVSSSVYNRYLLAPRVAGFALALLPLVLGASGIALVAGGSLFHAGSRPFAKSSWEGSTSLWIYSASGSLLPLATLELLLLVITTACYLLSLAFPGHLQNINLFNGYLLRAGWGLGLAVSPLIFLWLLITGTAASSHTNGVVGTASATSGILCVMVFLTTPFILWRSHGILTGGVAIGIAVILTSAAAIIGRTMDSLSSATPSERV
jgi:hypothetical protein